MSKLTDTNWQHGPIKILCDEIGFPFQEELETVEMLVAFVVMLVSNVSETRSISAAIAHVTDKPPSEASGEVLALTEAMLRETTRDSLIQAAGVVHEAARRLNPDNYNTDHLINMLSSCASAIRFGLKRPCQSRHAADAASHIWDQRYGITLHDDLTSAWQKDWARTQFQRAIIARMLAGNVDELTAARARIAKMEAAVAALINSRDVPCRECVSHGEDKTGGCPECVEAFIESIEP